MPGVPICSPLRVGPLARDTGGRAETTHLPDTSRACDPIVVPVDVCEHAVDCIHIGSYRPVIPSDSQGRLLVFHPQFHPHMKVAILPGESRSCLMMLHQALASSPLWFLPLPWLLLLFFIVITVLV